MAADKVRRADREQITQQRRQITDRNLTNRSGILPPIVKRGIAACIDLFICVLVIQLPLEIIIRLSGPSFFENLESAWPVTLYRSSSILLFCLRDLTGGVSHGKRILGLRAVNEDGSCKVSAGRLLLRNLTLVLWPIELYQLIKTGGVCRLGDKLAGTKVIEK